jgi:crotonobetainyl-CoA:carnitine CoA-transferase CaiB-like acyl-CoA transferase
MLSELKVLEMTDESGWFCGKLLADMGADVIRLEKPGQTPAAVYANYGKSYITLDIQKQRGRELFLQLISRMDVLLESLPPGFLSSQKLDFSELQRYNPALIMASISPYGRSSPSAQQPFSELTLAAAGGSVYLNGEPGKPPLKLYGPQSFLTASLFAANGILLALHHRRQSGRGQQIDISIQECVAGTLDHALPRYWSSGETARRNGSFYWNRTYYLFACRDGYIGLSFMQNWDTLVGWLESEGLAEELTHPRWQDPAVRLQNIGYVMHVIGRWTQSHSVDELVETAQLMHLPWSKVSEVKDILANPQLRDRGYFKDIIEFKSGFKYTFPGAPVKMSASPWQVKHQPAAYNSTIYREILTISQSEMDRLQAEGVL